MVLRGLKDKFKVKSGRKYLQEEIEKPALAVNRTKGITAIGCIVDIDSFSNAEVFYELIDEFSLRPNAIKIIGYKRDFDKNSPYAIQMFTDRDLGWKGKIENGYVLEFLGREYDMLINYYTDDNLLMKLLSVRTPARIKVGLNAADPKINDLILNTPLKEFGTFKSELKKILKDFKGNLMEALIGTGVALVTPFNDDLSVDTLALQKLVEHSIAGGVDYLVVLGTTAESVTLTKQEKLLVMKTVAKVNAGRLPLVVGMGGNDTQALVNDLKSIDFDEYSAILSVSPYYNKPTQEGIYQHFRAVAKASPLPVILYNVPSRTGSNMTAETTLRLAHEIPNIAAIKEASGDMVQINEIIKQKPEKFMVLAGDDFTALPIVLAGGSGVISVLGQGLPKQFSNMINLALHGDSDAAYEIHHSLLSGMHLIFEEGNPAGIKSILEILGISNAKVRLPLVEASLVLKTKIGAFMKPFQSVLA